MPSYHGPAGDVARLEGLHPVDLASDVKNDLPVAEGGTGASDAATARTNLDVDQAGTGHPVDLTSDVSGDLPVAEGGTGSSTASAARTALGVDKANLGFAEIATGTYTGDGTTSQEITGVGFQVVYVMITTREVSDSFGATPTWTSDVIIDDNAAGGVIDLGNAFRINQIIALGSDGFTVDDAGSDSQPNKDAEVYNYIVFG